MIATAIKTFEYMTLREIIHLKNKYLVQKYEDAIAQLKKDKMAIKIVETSYGESIADIVETIEETKMENRSESFFPGADIMVYPGIREAHAEKEYTCDFSGATISKGSLYVNYRPMLKNINNGNAYVLKRTIRIEPAYAYDLPTNISELEAFNDKILNYAYFDNEGIQYDYLFSQTGGLQFKKLSRRKKNENRYSK
ncbi:MAG: hypothetical protein IKF47_02375 [Bacilli bacterium]|nr:hypothetical protein [Bacilli bacterium]